MQFKSSAIASHYRTVSQFSQQFIQSTQTPTFIWNLCNKFFFCSVTFKNFKVSYQNLVTVTEMHVYMKASSAARQCALGVHWLKYLSIVRKQVK